MAVFNNAVVTVTDSVTNLSASIPTTGFPTAVIIQPATASIRLTLHGTNPNNTTGNGLVIPAGGIYRIAGLRDMQNCRMIRAGGSSTDVSLNFEQAD